VAIINPVFMESGKVNVCVMLSGTVMSTPVGGPATALSAGFSLFQLANRTVKVKITSGFIELKIQIFELTALAYGLRRYYQ
jgi:hypothetical protein